MKEISMKFKLCDMHFFLTFHIFERPCINFYLYCYKQLTELFSLFNVEVKYMSKMGSNLSAPIFLEQTFMKPACRAQRREIIQMQILRFELTFYTRGSTLF